MKNLLTNIKVRQAVATFLKGVLAGVCIALGAALFIVASKYTHKVFAGLLFPLGMILVLNFGYFLYTGKICFLFNHLGRTGNLHYSLQLLFGLLGNLLGALLIGISLSFAFKGIEFSLLQTIIDYTRMIVSNKLENNLAQTFVLAMFCNILIYFCVDGFAKIENHFAKHLVVILTISAFVICGFEHSIADMFYIALAGVFSWDAFLFILVVIAGNTIGGLLVPLIVKLIKFLEKR